jgi:hypothetical protein
MSAALDGADGAERVASWSWPYGAGRLETSIFEIDPDRLAFPDRVVLTTAALERLVAGLEADPATAGPAAEALVDRAVVEPDDAQHAVLIDRLRELAGR